MENYSNETVTCRTCLSLIKQDKTTSIYTFLEIITLCTSIKILEFDGLPSHICNKCRDMAQTAYEFRILCEESDKKLRERFSKIQVADEGCILKELITEVSESTEADISSNDSDQVSLKLHETSFEKTWPDKSNSDEDYDNHLNVKMAGRELRPFSCKFCNMSFLYRKSLEKHEKQHNKPNSNECHICGKTYSTLRRLSVHINIHNRKGSHLCQTCGKQFTLPENLLRHQRIHTGERRYHCITCNKGFVQSSELKSHMITHTLEKPYLCSFCGNKFARKLSLRVHIRRIHSNSNQIHTCMLCGRSFKDKRDLGQHKLIHTDERKHICKVCNKAFNRKSNLKVHEIIHSGHRPHVCHVCQRGFIQKHALNTHVQKIHPQ